MLRSARPTIFWSSSLAACLVAAVVATTASGLEVLRVADDNPGQWTLYNRVPNGSQLGLPVTLGDVDGDGFDDAILTPMNAISGPGLSRDGAGEITVVLSRGVIAGVDDIGPLAICMSPSQDRCVEPEDFPDAIPGSVVLVYGRDERDLLGTETAAADIDGDGYSDIIAGTQLGDGPENARPGAGEVAIIWGGPAFGGRVIDLADPLADVTFVYGADAGDRLGVWVYFGDLDGDGTQDAVLGADQGDGPENDRSDVGESIVLYGGSHLRSVREIDLRDTSFDTTVVYGIDVEDHSGTTVRAGDLDGDGTDELLIGAGLNRLSASVGNLPQESGHASRGGDGPDGLRTGAGEAYAVYLGPGARPASIDLRDPPASTVIIYGVDPGDSYGEELFVGDFNGDGFGEIAIGAIVGDGPNNTRGNAGELALVMGGADLPGSVIDLRDPPDGVTFFLGQTAGAIAGDTAMFADVDNDGRDDLVIASPNAPVDGDSRVGVTHIFFGREEALPAAIDLADVPGDLPVLLIEGDEFFDMLAYSMAYGDADGDGVTDVMLNVMDGDGFENLIPSSGDAHVFSGVELSRAAGRVPVIPTPTPRPEGCPGDCDGDGRVTVSELVAGVNDLLTPIVGGLRCAALDTDGNGTITVAELVAAVNSALRGC